jgi:nucleotide-binding universal stress UspA family protein
VVVDLAAPYCNILVPLDGSEVAEQALDTARQLAIALDATLHLAAVVPVRDDRAAAAGGVVPPHLSPAAHEERDRLVGYLATTAAGLLTGGLRVETQVLYGHPAAAILRESEYSDADLIVMATHGRSGLQQLWLGSVALKVVQGTGRPVLLVRARAAIERVNEPVAATNRRSLPIASLI